MYLVVVPLERTKTGLGHLDGLKAEVVVVVIMMEVAC